MFIANYKGEDEHLITWEVVTSLGDTIEIQTNKSDDVREEIAMQLSGNYFISGNVEKDEVVFADEIDTDGDENTCIRKQELIAKICTYYNTDRDDESGCSYNGKWFSVKNIIDIIEKCGTLD